MCRKSGTHGFEAEVEGAIPPSTVTNSGPFRKSTRKHSIYPLSLTSFYVAHSADWPPRPLLVIQARQRCQHGVGLLSEPWHVTLAAPTRASGVECIRVSLEPELMHFYHRLGVWCVHSQFDGAFSLPGGNL